MNDKFRPQFQDFERPPSQPMFNLPKPVSRILLVLLAVQVVMTFLPRGLFGPLLQTFAVVPARYTALIDGDLTITEGLFAVVGLVSYQLLHSGWVHFLMNSAWLAVFGTAVAYHFGASRRAQRRFYIFAAICGIFGALTHIAVYPSEFTPLVGASAAIAGLMAAALRIIFVQPVLRWNGIRSLAAIGDSRVMIFAGVYILLNVMTGVFGFGEDMSSGSIAWQAHIGGFFAGLVLIGFFANR